MTRPVAIKRKVNKRIAYLQKINQNRSLPRIYLCSNESLIDSEGNVLEARVALECSPELIDVPGHREKVEYPLNFEGMKVNYDEAKIILGKDCEQPGRFNSRINFNEWEMQAMMDTFRVRDRLRVGAYAFGVESVYENKIVIPVMYFRGIRRTGEKIKVGEYNPRRCLQYARETIREDLSTKSK